jgi:hypothetical protein
MHACTMRLPLAHAVPPPACARPRAARAPPARRAPRARAAARRVQRARVDMGGHGPLPVHQGREDHRAPGGGARTRVWLCVAVWRCVWLCVAVWRCVWLCVCVCVFWGRGGGGVCGRDGGGRCAGVMAASARAHARTHKHAARPFTRLNARTITRHTNRTTHTRGAQVNKIRELPQYPDVVVTHTDAAELYVWNTSSQPHCAPDATVRGVAWGARRTRHVAVCGCVYVLWALGVCVCVCVYACAWQGSPWLARGARAPRIT